MPKLAGALPHDHERVVDDLFNVFLAPVYAHDEAGQAPLILHVKLAKCLAVPQGNARYQVPIVISARAATSGCEAVGRLPQHW
jgi:hypothetical protein